MFLNKSPLVGSESVLAPVIAAGCIDLSFLMSVFCAATDAELFAFLTLTAVDTGVLAFKLVLIDDDDVRSATDAFLSCGGGGGGTLVRCVTTVCTVRGRELGGGLTRLVVVGFDDDDDDDDVLLLVVVVLDFFICVD